MCIQHLKIQITIYINNKLGTLTKALVSATHLSGALSASDSAAFFQTRERERKKLRNCARAHTIMTYFGVCFQFFSFFSIFKKISMYRVDHMFENAVFC